MYQKCIFSREKIFELLAPIAMKILFGGTLSEGEASRQKDCNEERVGF